MTGPEHYREAERLLSGVDDALDIVSKQDAQRPLPPAVVRNSLAFIAVTASLAQVHADLAAVAAAAEPISQTRNRG